MLETASSESTTWEVLRRKKHPPGPASRRVSEPTRLRDQRERAVLRCLQSQQAYFAQCSTLLGECGSLQPFMQRSNRCSMRSMWCLPESMARSPWAVRGSSRGDDSDALLHATLRGLGIADRRRGSSVKMSQTTASSMHVLRMPGCLPIKTRLFIEHFRTCCGVSQGGSASLGWSARVEP